MPVIFNKLNQRLIINLDSGKNLDIFAKSKADIPHEDFSSEHLQTFIAKGHIIVLKEEKSKKKESKASSAYPKKGRS